MQAYKIQALVESTVRNFKNRKVVIWGKCDDGDLVSQALFEQHGIATEYFIESNTNLLNGTTVRSVAEIENKRGEIYVVIPLRYHKSIVEQLNAFGFTAVSDFAYHFHNPITVTKNQMDHNIYSDIYGNKIIGDIGNCKIFFRGYNATITIGHSAYIEDDVEIHVEDEVEVVIGSNVGIFKNSKWSFHPKCKIRIGDNCKFQRDGDLSCGKSAEITIGSNTEIGSRYWIVAHNQTRIVIGKDCMFSRDIMLRTNDGHSIFDIHTGKNLNSVPNEQVNKSIIIEDHVWVGAKCSLLYNTKIGSGSIVGAHSLVKKEYPNNCMIAGVPARVIRKDIAWAKENNRDNMDIIPEEYVRFTRDME